MADDPMDVLIRLSGKLDRRKADAVRWSDYYEGKTPLKFVSPEFSTMSGGLFDGFTDNWCQVIPDAVVERLSPTAFRNEDGDVDEDAGKAWRRSECDVEFSLAALETLISGRSFVLVWKPSDDATPEITFKDCASAIVEYEPGRRNVRKHGLTRWRDGAYDFATLFVRDSAMVHRFQRNAGGPGQWTTRTEGLEPNEPADFGNPMGQEVPLVEIANRSRLRGKPSSEIASVAPLQDAMNTLWAHLLTASDALAVPARAILNMDRPQREILDEETGEVAAVEDLPIGKFRKDRILWLEGKDAKIAEFSAADLSNYLGVIETAVQHIAAQTRTPPHYLLGQMVNISGDALAAAESGLVAKVVERQRMMGAALREVMRLEAIAAGNPERAASLALGKVQWRDPQFRSDGVFADALTKFKAIGVPDEALWEKMPDVDAETIKRWLSMRDDQAAAIVGGDIAGLFGAKPEPEPAEGA